MENLQELNSFPKNIFIGSRFIAQLQFVPKNIFIGSK